jgi:2-oxoglutarate ferredoxin oxidoreductase subunit beta
VSFNYRNTYAWYNERVYDVSETTYDPHDQIAAFTKSLEWNARIPIGVLYRSDRRTFEEGISALKAGPLVHQPHNPQDFTELLNEFIP